MFGSTNGFWRYVTDILTIYAKFAVLAIIIYFIVDWYVRNYEEKSDNKDEDIESKSTYVT